MQEGTHFQIHKGNRQGLRATHLTAADGLGLGLRKRWGQRAQKKRQQRQGCKAWPSNRSHAAIVGELEPIPFR
jgi:hypothetical protein